MANVSIDLVKKRPLEEQAAAVGEEPYGNLVAKTIGDESTHYISSHQKSATRPVCQHNLPSAPPPSAGAFNQVVLGLRDAGVVEGCTCLH